MWANLGPYHYARLRGLAERFDVTAVELFANESQRGWAKAEAPDGVKVVTLSNGVPHHGRPWSLRRKLWSTLNRLSPEAMLAPGYSDPCALVAAVWAKWKGVPAVMMCESTREDRPRNAFKERLKKGLVQSLFSAAQVGGVRSAAYAGDLGFPSHELAFGHNVVENRFFAGGAERLRSVSEASEGRMQAAYFLYVGRLAAEKNLFALIEAFASYRRSGGTWEMVLVGAGPLEADLRAKAAALGVAQATHLLGARPPEGLLECYASAGALVLPSLSEPWGLVVNEAMAAGLPVIVSDKCGCVDDLVEEGANGFLFDPHDSGAFVRCLTRMAALPERDRARMGRRSTEIIARYTPERCAAEVEALLGRLGRL